MSTTRRRVTPKRYILDHCRYGLPTGVAPAVYDQTIRKNLLKWVRIVDDHGQGPWAEGFLRVHEDAIQAATTANHARIYVASILTSAGWHPGQLLEIGVLPRLPRFGETAWRMRIDALPMTPEHERDRILPSFVAWERAAGRCTRRPGVPRSSSPPRPAST